MTYAVIEDFIRITTWYISITCINIALKYHFEGAFTLRLWFGLVKTNPCAFVRLAR